MAASKEPIPKEPVPKDSIIAAGVVVLRNGDAGQEVLVVHRPRRKDWSLPKGKVEANEALPVTAVRECDEETGYRVCLNTYLGIHEYESLGAPKVVHYWRASVRSEEGFVPDDEVDEVRWIALTDCSAVLTYPADAALVARAAELPPTDTFIVARHAKAMKRVDYVGDDDQLRPLAGRGRSEAKRLADVFEAFCVNTLESSVSLRCTSTLTPYATRAELPITVHHTLSEQGHLADPDATARTMTALWDRPGPLVVCGHRPVLPTMVAAAAEAAGLEPADIHDDPAWDPRLPPAGMVIWHRDDAGGVVAAERHVLR